MSAHYPSSNDEIDLFKLLDTLWDGKWFIISFTVLATLIGFGYSQVSEPKYNVSVTYNLNDIDSLRNEKICSSKSNCFDSLLSSGWTKNKKKESLSLSTTSPLDINEYAAQLEEANKVKTNEIYTSAKENLLILKAESIEFISMIKAEFPRNNFMLGPLAFDKILYCNKIIHSIDNGNSAFTFGPILISKKTPAVPLILFISAVFGGMLGIAVTLIRSEILNRKKN